jgi:hypothetical protein
MNDTNSIVTATGWCVSGMEGSDITGHVLHIFRHYELPLIGPPKCEGHTIRILSAQAECYGTVFGPDPETGRKKAREYLIEHGFLKRFSRNTVTFHSNRTFRKRTGFSDIHAMRGETDFLWDCKMRNGARRAERSRT